MDYRVLGKTGLRVSAVGFGGAAIGIQGYIDGKDRDSPDFISQTKVAISRAVAGGINFFDTAPSYGDGRSELRLGEALERVRDEVVLATKFSWKPDSTIESIQEEVRSSLERLKTRQVDLLQVHGVNVDLESARSLLDSCVPDALARLKSQGLARYVGFTAETTSAGVELLLESGIFDTMQVGYSIAATAACDYRWAPFGVIPKAKRLGIGVLTMRSSTSGLLQRLVTSEFPTVDARQLTATCIRYVLSTPEVDCALIGMQTAQDVSDGLALLQPGARRYDVAGLNRRT